MFDAVKECVVKRKTTGSAIAGRISMIFLDVLIAAGVCFTILIESSIVAIVFILLIISLACTVLAFRNTNVE